MLTISVKNFGPIAEGSVDLKPLTIFVGPSNTGKSYMATAVYAAMRAASHFRLAKIRNVRMAGNAWAISTHIIDENITEESLKGLQEWAHEQVRNPRDQSNRLVESLPEEIRPWVETAVYEQLTYVLASVVDNLRHIHGELEDFVSRGSDHHRFRLFVRQDSPVVEFEIPLFGGFLRRPSVDIGKLTIPEKTFDLSLEASFKYEENRLWEEIAGSLVNSLSDDVFSNFPTQSYYLPASRSGISQGHKVLSATLVDQSSRIGLQQFQLPTLPGIATDFLSYLIRLDRRKSLGQSNENLRRAVDFLQVEVLHGEIDLSESDELPYPEIFYETTSERFALQNSSSMVSELAPLILFLKYLVRPGELIILEEPESHLHPAAQRQLARGIVRLVNAGVKVLITTHSDIIISQFNNLLALNQASPELIAEGGFEPEDFLQEDQVGAYLFQYSQELGGSAVKRLEIDPGTGIDEDEFAAVFEALYNESIALQRDRN